MRGAWVEIIIIGTHTLRAPVPIDSSIDTHQIQNVRRSSVRQKCCAHTKKTKRRVLCPRVTKDSRSLRHRSGCGVAARFATATSGAAYSAAAVRHGPPWPLPVNAPKSIFQKWKRAPLLLEGRGWWWGS